MVAPFCATIRVMKKLLLTAVLCLGAGQAQSPAVAVDSAAPLLGALESITEHDGSFATNYIPGYGLVIVGYLSPYSSTTSTEATAQVASGIMTGLLPTIKGIQEGEWVSVSARVTTDESRYVTIRAKPNQPESLEVWVDGVKQ